MVTSWPSPGKAEAFLASGEAASDNYHLLTDGNVFFIQIGDVCTMGRSSPGMGGFTGSAPQAAISTSGFSARISSSVTSVFRRSSRFGVRCTEHHGFEELYNILFEGQLF